MARAGARGMQERSPRPAGFVDDFFGQDLVIVGIVGRAVTHKLDEPRPATPNTDDLIPFSNRPDGHGSNSRIETRNIAAAGQYGNHTFFRIDIDHGSVSI